MMFSQSSFLGRLRHFVDIIDPSTLFVSEVKLPVKMLVLQVFCMFGMSFVCNVLSYSLLLKQSVI